MGRHNGVWSPVYGQVWTHRKTAAATAWLVANVRRTSSAVAPFLVVGWLNRLNVWCLDNHSHGSLQGLSEARVGVLAWPEAIEAGMAAAKAGEAVLGALRAGGFIEGAEPTIHEFEEFHAAILERRRPNLDTDHQRNAGRRSADARRARSGTAQPNRQPNRPPNRDGSTAPNREPEPSSEPSPEPSDRTGPDRTGPDHAQSARARATSPGSGPERGFATTPSSPVAEPPAEHHEHPSPQAPGAGRSRPDPGLPTPADPSEQPLDLEARDLIQHVEIVLGCAASQARKVVTVLLAAGVPAEFIRTEAQGSSVGTKPWLFQNACADAWSQRCRPAASPFLGS